MAPPSLDRGAVFAVMLITFVICFLISLLGRVSGDLWGVPPKGFFVSGSSGIRAD